MTLSLTPEQCQMLKESSYKTYLCRVPTYKNLIEAAGCNFCNGIEVINTYPCKDADWEHPACMVRAQQGLCDSPDEAMRHAMFQYCLGSCQANVEKNADFPECIAKKCDECPYEDDPKLGTNHCWHFAHIQDLCGSDDPKDRRIKDGCKQTCCRKEKEYDFFTEFRSPGCPV